MRSSLPLSRLSIAGFIAGAAISVALPLLPSLASAAAEVSGCWSRSWQEPYLREKLVVIDKDGWGEEIEFVYTSNTVQHTCTIPGLAKENKSGGYTFKDTSEYWTRKGWEGYGYPAENSCELVIELSEEQATIKSSGDCRGLCGYGEIQIEIPSGCK